MVRVGVMMFYDGRRIYQALRLNFDILLLNYLAGNMLFVILEKNYKTRHRSFLDSFIEEFCKVDIFFSAVLNNLFQRYLISIE